MEIEEEVTQQLTKIRNIRGVDLPKAWAEQAGVGNDDQIQVTIERVNPKQNKTTLEELMALVMKIRAYPDRDPTFTEDDLYDENGLPK